jgi:hypothetical protein
VIHVKHCSSCGRETPESATVCDQCDPWAEEAIALPFPDPEPIAAPSVPESVALPSAAPSAGLNLREVLVIGVAIVGGAIITFGLLAARGVASSNLAAANIATPNPRLSSRATVEPASIATQRWTSENRASWVGNRPHSAAFELAAENTVSIWLNHFRPMLVVRCVSSATDVFVFTGSAIKIEPQTEDHTVTIRFDDEPELTERWPDSADHDALFAHDGAAFVQRLNRARTLRFGYTPHNAAPVTAQFQVSGLRELIEPAARDCGWKK